MANEPRGEQNARYFRDRADQLSSKGRSCCGERGCVAPIDGGLRSNGQTRGGGIIRGICKLMGESVTKREVGLSAAGHSANC